MAKGGKSKGFISQGLYKNVSQKTRNGVKSSKDSGVKLLEKQKAWLEGSNPWITIENPNKEQTNKKFIRVRYNDMAGGSAKDREKRMFVLK
jgi:hypothetical protein